MKSKIRTMWLPVLLLVLLTAVFIYGIYVILDRAAVGIVTTYIDELANHDMKTVSDFVSDKWAAMEGIYSELCDRQVTDADAMMKELNVKSYAKDFDHIYLLDSGGKLYSDTHTVYPEEKNDFLPLFKSGSKQFAMRYDDKVRFREYQKEYMLYGLNFSDAPLILPEDDVEFIGMVVLNDISKIRTRMRITSFNGRGYASVIDSTGQYIVTEATVSTLNQYKNFFEIIRQGRIESTNADEIIRKITHREAVRFWYVNTEGVRKFISVQPIEGQGWSFVTAVEESVVTDQTNQFILIITGIIAVLLTILCVVFIVFYFATKKLKKFYSSVVDGVYNKQYYNDKLVNEKVCAVAIIDLDHLKHINDHYGHLAGDKAIEKTALTLLQNAGEFGDVIRFGGDEFVIVFKNNIDKVEFRTLLEVMVNDIRRARLPQFPEVRMTFSIGGCYAEGTAEEILKLADDLLYEAKKMRNRVVTNVQSENNENLKEDEQ